MMLGTVSADEMRAAQLISGITMAIWIGVGVLPPLQPYAHTIRRTLLMAYLICCMGFIAYVMANRGAWP